MTARVHPRWAGSATALMISLACASEPLPESMPQTDERSQPSFPRVQPEATRLEPDRCDVLVEGERAVNRALLNTKRGVVQTVVVVGGHKLEIVCPQDRSEREGVLMLAELEAEDELHTLDNVVRWTVDLDPDPELEKVYVRDAERGLPADINEEDLAQIKVEWSDMIEWQAASADDPKVEDPPARLRPKQVVAAEQVEVEFSSGRLKWAEIVYTNQKTKRKRRLTLNPSDTRTLEPGRYTLSVRYPVSSQEWRDAGSFDIEPGVTKVSIRMVEAPSLHAQVVGAQ